MNDREAAVEVMLFKMSLSSNRETQALAKWAYDALEVEQVCQWCPNCSGEIKAVRTHQDLTGHSTVPLYRHKATEPK